MRIETIVKWSEKLWRRRRMWQGNIIASQCNWIRNSPAL